MQEEEIVARVKQLYPEATVDVAGEDCNFELFVISEAFNGLGMLQRQKAILALFSEEIRSGELHALSIKAKTTEELNQSSGLVQIKL